MGIWHNLTTGTEQGGGPALLRCEVEKADGTLVDVAGDVLHPTGGLTIQMAGRANELARTDDGNASLTLNNAGGAYTPGSSSAATALSMGMPLRVTETVGRKSFDHFAGTLNQPQAEFNNLPNGAGDTVEVTAIDLMGEQQQGRTYVSTLAEWIRYRGGDTLSAYYPLLDASLPALELVANRPSLVDAFDDNRRLWTRSAGNLIQPGRGETIPYDDAAGMLFDPLYDEAGTSTLFRGFLRASSLGTPITLGSGQVLTVSMWVNLTAGDANLFTYGVILGGSDINSQFVEIAVNNATGRWRLGTLVDGYGIVGLAGPVATFGRWTFLSAQVQLSSTTQRFWTDRYAVTGTATGSPPASVDFTQMFVGWGIAGSAAHVQVYLGDADAFTYDDHVEQWQQGTHPITGGLRWQRTDERIRSLARYAGIPEGRLQLDRGTVYMPEASLAGSTFLAEAQSVVDTEQGRLLTTGDGRLRFDSKSTTRYNL